MNVCQVRIIVGVMVFCSAATTSRAAPRLVPAFERSRQALVAQELERVKEVALTFDASSLDEREYQMLKHLWRAGDIVDELALLSIHPLNLSYRDEAQQIGTMNDRRLLSRNLGPWCLTSDDPLCNALPTLPERRIGWHLWPEGMTEAALDLMRTDRHAAVLLSPFTVVRLNEREGYEAIPFSRWPLLSSHLAALAAELHAAASLAPTKTLRRFLRNRARAVVSHDPLSYDKSDLDWIRIVGPWEVTVGPYETSLDPMKQKAFFEMIIGRVDDEVTERLAPLTLELPAMEHVLVERLGGGMARVPRIDRGTVVKAVRVIRVAGSGRRPVGAVVAYHLPNRGEAVEKGLAKNVILLDQQVVAARELMNRAAFLLAPAEARLVSADADLMNVVLHELCHGLGVVTKPLGPWRDVIEELKADVLALWFLPYLEARGVIDNTERRRRQATAIASLLILLDRPELGTPQRMAAVELRKLLEAGAVYFDKQQRALVDFTKIDAAVTGLARDILRIQSTGDRDAAEQLVTPAISGHVAERPRHFVSPGFTLDYTIQW